MGAVCRAGGCLSAGGLQGWGRSLGAEVEGACGALGLDLRRLLPALVAGGAVLAVVHAPALQVLKSCSLVPISWHARIGAEACVRSAGAHLLGGCAVAARSKWGPCSTAALRWKVPCSPPAYRHIKHPPAYRQIGPSSAYSHTKHTPGRGPQGWRCASSWQAGRQHPRRPAAQRAPALQTDCKWDSTHSQAGEHVPSCSLRAHASMYEEAVRVQGITSCEGIGGGGSTTLAAECTWGLEALGPPHSRQHSDRSHLLPAPGRAGAPWRRLPWASA